MKRKGKAKYIFTSILALFITLGGIVPNPTVFIVAEQQINEGEGNTEDKTPSSPSDVDQSINDDSELDEGFLIDGDEIASDTDIDEGFLIDGDDLIDEGFLLDESEEFDNGIMTLALSPVTFHIISPDTIVAANGTPIIVKPGTGTGYYHVYIDNGEKGVWEEGLDVEVDFTGQQGVNGDLTKGFYIQTIVGGSVDKQCYTDTHVTLQDCEGLKVVGGGFVSKKTTTTKLDASVAGDTTIIIDTGNKSLGDIYGGGYVAPSAYTTYDLIANVTENTNIIVNSGKVTNLYGGGFSGYPYYMNRQSAIVQGNTNITINDGTITNLYGGAKSTGASGVVDIAGTVSVTINGGAITNLYGCYSSTKSSQTNGNSATNGININAVKIVINDGTIRNIFGGGSTADSGRTLSTIKTDVDIEINDGIITGRVHGGGFSMNTSNVTSSPLQCVNVNGNTKIVINGGTFTSEYAEKLPTIIGGGSVNSNYGGEAIVGGSTYVEINGGKFSASSSNLEQSIVYGGGAFGSNNSRNSNLTVTGDSSVIITGGLFEGTVLAGGKIGNNVDTSVKGIATLKISGGTIKGLAVGNVANLDNAMLSISGGSIGTIPEDLLDSSQYKTIISLQSLSGEGPDIAEISRINITGQDYGVKNLYTDSDGKLYLYLKNGVTVQNAVLADNKEYKGLITVNEAELNEASFINDSYVSVENIELLSKDTIYSWLPYELKAKVSPDNATFHNIIWSVSDDGGTNAEINENNVTIKNSGSLKLKAAIENGKTMSAPFIREFTFQAIYKPLINGGLQYQSVNDKFYAGGNPLIITKGTKGLNFYYDFGEIGKLDEADNWINLNDLESFTIKQPDADETTGFTFKSLPTIYGGASEKVVENTCITLLDGEVAKIYGGGERLSSISSTDQYNITGIAKINLFGGKVDKVYGGNYYGYTGYSTIESKVKNSIITLADANVGEISASGDCTMSKYVTVDNSIINIESGNHPDLEIFVGSDKVQDGSYRTVVNSQININGGNIGGTIDRFPVSRIKQAPTSFVTFNGGIFNGIIMNTNSLKIQGKVEIKGGIVGGIIKTFGEDKIYITGGNVSANNGSGNPLIAYNQSAIRLYKTVLSIENGKNLPIDVLNTNLADNNYGLNDVKADANGILTVYLPSATNVYGIMSGKASYVTDDGVNITTNTANTASGILRKEIILLAGILNPASINGYAEGQDISMLGLPTEVEIVTTKDIIMKAAVEWDLDSCDYDPSSKASQQFYVSGTVQLPENINANGVSLTVKVKITLKSRIQDKGSGIIVSGNIEGIDQKELQIIEIPANEEVYQLLEKSLGEEYLPIGAYEIAIITKTRLNNIGPDQYEITFTVDEQYNGKMLVVKQFLDDDVIKTMKARVQAGKVSISTSDLTFFMLGVPIRDEHTVTTADELKKVILDAGTTPTKIYLGADFVVESTPKNEDTLEIIKGADIVIINESGNRILTLNRPVNCKPVIHIEEGGKLSFQSSAPQNFWLFLNGDTDINTNTLSNILNEGELVFNDLVLSVYDKGSNTIHSLGNLKMDNCSLSVPQDGGAYRNMWGLIKLEGDNSETCITHSEFSYAYASVIYAEKIKSLIINDGTFENNGVMASATNYLNNSALYVKDAEYVEIRNSEFNDNLATYGGAATFDGVQSGIISNTKFMGNKASDKGGTLYFVGGTEYPAPGNVTPELSGHTSFILDNIDVSNGSLVGNGNYNQGGAGIYVDNNAKVVMKGGSVHNCAAGEYVGGGIMIYGSGQVELTNKADISYNSASAGGGVHSYNKGAPDNLNSLVLTSAHIHHNTASQSEGGGIFMNNNTPLRMDNVVIRNNSATTEGGGLWTCDKGYITTYSYEGMAIYDNKVITNGIMHGVDVHVNGPEFTKEINFSECMLGDGKFNWLKWNNNMLIPDYMPAEFEDYKVTLQGYSDSLNLKANPSEDAKDAAMKEATVVIENNIAIKGGGVAINGETISGQEMKTLTVEKLWTGDISYKQPKSIEVQLYKDGKAFGNPVMLDEGSMWSYTWINLDKDAEWTVKEISKLPSGYLSPVYTGQGGNKVVITNTYLASASSDYDGHIGGISSVSVVKHWGGDVNENQPTQVKVQLYKNNEPYGKPVILNAQNNWSYRWQLLSNRFTWTVDEVDVPEGYTKIINQVGDATIITNIYDPEIEPLNPEQPQAPEESEGIEGSKDSENTEDTENPNTASIGQSINFYLLLCCLSGVLLVICDLKRNFK